MPFEGRPPGEIPTRLEMSDARLGRGTYTDDTQMMIALCESVLERGRVDEDHLARAFLSAYDPRRGYGAGTRQVLRAIASGVEPAEAAAQAMGGRGSFGNGAAMRIAPVAVRWFDRPAELRSEAERSARVTHTHPLGLDGARVQAAAIGAAIRGEEPLAAAQAAASTGELRGRLEDAAAHLEVEPIEVGELLGNSGAAHESVPAAIVAAAAHDGFEEAVDFAIRCGGDTDTIGAMAGAIAGAREGASAIPTRWLEALEDGPKGRSYVEHLARRLARAALGD
jgi:poly(ADP-ribose) glycohydrolase ARH3